MATVLIALVLFTACSSAPQAVRPAQINAQQAAADLLAQHDANADGVLSAEEAIACPAVAANFVKYDANTDGQIDEDEIATRFQQWSADGAGVLRVGCRVTLDGRPLAGANVQLEPEFCFEGALQPATGTTDGHGQCSLTVDPANLPEELSRVRGVQPGLYAVKITHPEISLPEKYNSEATLGLEVASDTLGPAGTEFALSSR